MHPIINNSQLQPHSLYGKTTIIDEDNLNNLQYVVLLVTILVTTVTTLYALSI